ncbi:MAG TPA: PIN domain-containing protein [Isosphaeraceae bacterium]|nr:PIN domain-containing protein [Isosphaeraceae bacterium]
MADRRVLLDTGPLVALLAESDSQHHRCIETLATLTPPLLTCWPVLTEAAWILRNQPRPLDRISEAHAAGLFEIHPLDNGALSEIAGIMRRYEDTGLQLADAALAYIAEHEGIRTVFTLDRRDFLILRLKRGRSLRLIPDVS